MSKGEKRVARIIDKLRGGWSWAFEGSDECSSL